jgi:hypothetical protein
MFQKRNATRPSGSISSQGRRKQRAVVSRRLEGVFQSEMEPRNFCGTGIAGTTNSSQSLKRRHSASRTKVPA